MTSGIYMMLHKPTGCFYVGLATNFAAAEASWRSRLRTGNVPARVAQFRRDQYDYEFHMLQEFAPQTAAEVAQLFKLRAVVLRECRNTYPFKLLNTNRHRAKTPKSLSTPPARTHT